MLVLLLMQVTLALLEVDLLLTVQPKAILPPKASKAEQDSYIPDFPRFRPPLFCGRVVLWEWLGLGLWSSFAWTTGPITKNSFESYWMEPSVRIAARPSHPAAVKCMVVVCSVVLAVSPSITLPN
jgi:hypothetical protein